MKTYKEPIFVCGLPRSGSTLLELRISRAAGVLRLAEPLYLSPWRRDFRYFLRTQVGDLSVDENLRRLVDIVFSEHGGTPGLTGSFWRLRDVKAVGEEALKRNVYESLRSSDRSLAAIFRTILKEITIYNGKQRCSVPFPVHVHYVPTLMEWFPDARFIFLTRDPRATAISKTNDPGGTAVYNKRWPYLKFLIRKAMVGFVTVQYIQAARAHDKVKGRSNYMLVRYEDMVMDPVQTMRRICEFAGLEFKPEMLEQSADRAQPSSITGELRTTADARAAANWKQVITPFERWAVTTFTRRSMERFGFDCDSHPIYSEANQTVSPAGMTPSRS